MEHATILLAALLLGTGGAEVAPAQPGAKELFYDPLARSVTSAPLAAPEPSAEPRPASDSRPHPQLDAQGRRLASQPTATDAPHGGRVLGLSYWIELEQPGGGPGRQVTESRAFRSGERIRLHFRSNTDGHISLIQLGASGTASVLFPDPPRGLVDDRLRANEGQVLPSPGHWFRFDDNPGTERLLVLFGASRSDLDRFPTRPAMDSRATLALLESTQPVRGSKDLLIESETRTSSEIGTYGVNLAGQPVILEISLEHR